LPIEEEVHTPGSPIISPADLTTPLDPIDINGIIPRRTSVLSNTTVDEDDVGDGLAVEGDSDEPSVPTLVEWMQGGEKVYVTGTFAAWDKKYRLNRGYVHFVICLSLLLLLEASHAQNQVSSLLMHLSAR
jgi:hypothetical protein